jgi:hypothetical protein
LQHSDETSETLETYSCNMGFAWTNGGMPMRRSTAVHGPRCAVAARATRRWAWRHTNLVPLVCLLEYPSWSLADLVEAAPARQLGGGGRGDEATWWRRARQTRPSGECSTGDRRRRGGVEWANGHDNAGRKWRSEHRGARTEQADI